MPIEKAISSFRFAYGPGALLRQMKPPPATLPFAAVSDPVARLFERAFGAGGANADGRPRAEEWVSALVTLGKNLKPCIRHTGHQYLASLPACPFCVIEAQSGLMLFHIVISGTLGVGGTFDVEAIWAKIRAVPYPGPLPILPQLPPFVPPPAFSSPLPLPPLTTPEVRLALSQEMQGIKRTRLLRQWIVFGITALIGILSVPIGNWFAIFYIMMTGYVLGYTLLVTTFNRKVKIQTEIALQSVTEQYQDELALRFAEEVQWAEKERKYTEKRQNIEAAVYMAEKQCQDIRQRWEREANSEAYDARLAELERAKTQLQDLTAQLQKRLRRLEQDGAKRQLENYLDRFKLQSASIDGIGPGRKATLQSYGVETAADVKENIISSIPGFGPSLTNVLLAWRGMHEKRFIYNPSLGIDAADQTALEQEFGARRAKLENALLDGPNALRQLVQEIVGKRSDLRPKVEKALQTVITARTGYQTLDP